MADTEQDRPSSEELLSAALRRLARSSPQAASPALERVLVDAFHRRHRQRRTIRFALAVAACLAMVAGVWFWRVIPRYRAERFAHQQIGQRSVTGAAAESRISSNAGGATFVALPSFALSPPEEDLRILRVEMPVSSLRLLGARVNDELSTQKIVADILVGADGTPYAFRIIS